jgi:tetraacyldisaccharide 4'-kinase
MARDLEIAVIDASRGVGNGLLLPAGPLREPVERLSEVDFVVSHGGPTGLSSREYGMYSRPLRFRRLSDGTTAAVTSFHEHYPWVHAICGIGNPDRFLRSLTDLGISVEPHVYPDHHGYTGEEIDFAGGVTVVCTDKDAIKLSELDINLSHVWALEIAAELDAEFTAALMARLDDLDIVPAQPIEPV